MRNFKYYLILSKTTMYHFYVKISLLLAYISVRILLPGMIFESSHRMCFFLSRISEKNNVLMFNNFGPSIPNHS